MVIGRDEHVEAVFFNSVETPVRINTPRSNGKIMGEGSGSIKEQVGMGNGEMR